MKQSLAILIHCLPLLFNLLILQGKALPYWEEQGFYGGQVNVLTLSSKDPHRIFAGCWAGDGLFKSIDQGITWENIAYFRNREVFSIAIGGEHQQNVWVAFNMFLAKSTDGGNSWRECFSAKEEERFCYCVVAPPHDGDTVYLGCGGAQFSDSGGAIFKTNDGGTSWKKLPLVADHNIQSIAIYQGNPEEVWAVSGQEFIDAGSIYRSVNGGESWVRLSTGLEETWFDEIVLTSDKPPLIVVGGGKGIYRSKDGGTTWARLRINGWPENSCCRALALDPSDNHKVYAQASSKFSKSTDSGNLWETCDLTIGPASFQLLSLAVDPQKPGVLYGGDVCLGIIKSENDGAGWDIINQGLKANHIFHTAINYQDPQQIAIGTMMGVYLNRERSLWEVLSYYPSYMLTFDPHHGSTLFAGFDGWLGKYILKGGEPEEYQIPFPEHTISAIAINPSHPQILYVGTEAYSLDRGTLHKSTDGGESWRRVLVKSAPISVIAIDPHHHETLYAGTGLFYAPIIRGNLYKSINGGECWQLTPLGDMVVNTIAIDHTYAEVLYVGCGAPGSDSAAGVLKSEDGGESWEWSSRGLPFGSPVVDLELDAEDSQMLFAATFDRGVFTSRDGGAYWTLLGMSDYWVYDLSPSLFNRAALRVGSSSFTSNRFYTGTASGLYHYNSTGTGMVAGMVTASATGRGITGAQVTATSGGIASTIEGAYLLVTAAGTTTLSATAEGYSSISQTLTVIPGDTLSVDFTLTSLFQMGTISGEVTDCSTTSPLGGATILVNPGGYSAKSMVTGNYTLNEVATGIYTISAFKNGYSMASMGGVTVSEGETHFVALSLSPLGTGTIEGTIRDALRGEALEGVTVLVDPGSFFTTSDSEGSYLISEIKTGSYTVLVSLEGYLPYQSDLIEVGQNETITLYIQLQPCPLSILKLSPPHLQKLRRIRDEIFLQNHLGKELVSLFYEHAPMLSTHINRDPALKARLVELIHLSLPTLDYLLTAKKGEVSLTLITKAEECLKDLEDIPELTLLVHELRTFLHHQNALKKFGISLEKP